MWRGCGPPAVPTHGQPSGRYRLTSMANSAHGQLRPRTAKPMADTVPAHTRQWPLAAAEPAAYLPRLGAPPLTPTPAGRPWLSIAPTHGHSAWQPYKNMKRQREIARDRGRYQKRTTGRPATATATVLFQLLQLRRFGSAAGVRNPGGDSEPVEVAPRACARQREEAAREEADLRPCAGRQ